MSMTDDEFYAFIDASFAELEQKQAMLSASYSLGSGLGRWWFDQANGKLQFFDAADQLEVEVEVIEIGSYSAKNNTWKWAWSNAAGLPALRERSAKIKELATLTGNALFDFDYVFEIGDEAMAWELTAMAVHLLGALGCYKAATTNNGDATFLAIMALKPRS
ncbi:DUF6882 domain-containing protein [uncultured Deefgea sp.]|uniref:DUF6882 domain-containing protein n=1 Tax=uncultured Deefgea sp. TaxID=1304914 RepID=UPI002612D730|nr:DUF6882 domain-containing protein [uncultured Deefgea sp.]